MYLIDTHCHIHEANYPLDIGDTISRAHEAGVGQMICVGTSVQSSREALEFSVQHEGVYASVGVHPHDSEDGWGELEGLIALSGSPSTLPLSSLPSPASRERQIESRRANSKVISLHSAELALLKQSSNGQEITLELVGQSNSAPLEASDVALQLSSHSPTAVTKHLQPEPILMRSQEGPGAKPFRDGRGRKGEHNKNQSKLVAIGEIGLDYFYTHSPREVQIQALEAQIDLALRYNLPIIFHVRDAFDDFWPIFDNFHGIRGELHSFTDTVKNMQEGIKRGLFIGVNGISTFTKDPLQWQMFAAIPLEKMLLETDAPFLTPVPFRGKVNEPAFVRNVAEYHATIRHISIEEVAAKTTANARALFALS